LNTDISQGSALTRLSVVGYLTEIYSIRLLANGFWKSVSIWQSYG